MTHQPAQDHEPAPEVTLERLLAELAEANKAFTDVTLRVYNACAAVEAFIAMERAKQP